MAETTKAKTTRTKKATTKAKEEPAVTADIVKDELVDARDEQMKLLSESNAMLMAQIEDMKRQLAEVQAQKTQVIAYPADTERVQFMWQAPVSDDNEVDFGPGGMYGRIVGKTGSFYVPKNELSRILSADVRSYLDMRWLIVLNGLTDEEREAMGVDYAKGELLDKKMFRTMIDSGEKLLEIYPELCKQHKDIVAKTYYETWLNDPKRIERDIVVKLYKIDKNAAFQKIIEGMNAQELAD